jgi:SAM-dependent methyltransferase
MDVSAFYHYQTAARGHHTSADVDHIAASKYPLYDSILRGWLPEDKDTAIYELACGPGMFLRWLRARGYRNIAGSDSSGPDVALATAVELPAKVADSLAELRAMPAASQDCLVAFDFYEHLPKEVLLDFLHDAHRVLRPGGRLLLRGPNGASPVVGSALFNDITHYWALTPVAFRAILKMAGFRSVDCRDDAVASLQKLAWLKAPFVRLAQALLRAWIRTATRESPECLSASMFLCATK